MLGQQIFVISVVKNVSLFSSSRLRNGLKKDQIISALKFTWLQLENFCILSRDPVLFNLGKVDIGVGTVDQ